jgi:hypothetical protein
MARVLSFFGTRIEERPDDITLVVMKIPEA